MITTQRHLPARATLLLAVSLALVACTGGATPSPTPAALDTGAAAMAAIAAQTPWFDGVKVKDPNAVGATAWWEATPVDAATPPAAWLVTITVGWGRLPGRLHQPPCLDVARHEHRRGHN